MSDGSVVIDPPTHTIETISEQIVNTAVQATDEGSNTLTFFILTIILAAIIVYLLMKNKSKVNKTEIGLIGERGSGKTQLFIGLCGGKPFQTVPSIANNTSQMVINNKNFKICDFFGDNLSKQEVLSNIPKYHTIIHLIDGADSKKLSDAALFLYRVLINKLFQKEPCNLIVFLNKQDQKGFHGKEKLIKRIEDEIETIKYSRKNQPEDNEGEQDFLRNDKSRFDFSKHEIQIITGSAKKDRSKLIALLEELSKMIRISKPIGFCFGVFIGMLTRESYVYPYPLKVEDLKEDYIQLSKKIEQRQTLLQKTIEQMRKDLQNAEGAYITKKHKAFSEEESQNPSNKSDPNLKRQQAKKK